LLTERQKLILLADKSEFGWKTVEKYSQHELADDEADGKKIRRAEERAEKALKCLVPCRILGVTRRLASRVTRVTGCPLFVYPAFHQDARCKFLVLRFLDPKVFQVTSD